jgi:hypothetical protein
VCSPSASSSNTLLSALIKIILHLVQLTFLTPWPQGFQICYFLASRPVVLQNPVLRFADKTDEKISGNWRKHITQDSKSKSVVNWTIASLIFLESSFPIYLLLEFCQEENILLVQEG